MEHFRQYIKIGSMFLLVAVAAYYVVTWIWSFIVSVQRVNQYQCRAQLYLGQKKCCIKGMIDTGNGLRDPVTNEPVSILDRKTAMKFLGEEKNGGRSDMFRIIQSESGKGFFRLCGLTKCVWKMMKFTGLKIR